MDLDITGPRWPKRAVCRWSGYFALWTMTLFVCLVSWYHIALRVAGAFLGFLLAVSLPLIFATLFEETYSRRGRHDLPFIVCPGIAAAVAAFGVFALLQGSEVVGWVLSSDSAKSAQEVCRRFSGVPRDELPRTICMEQVFVKTQWEAGKLECARTAGHIQCVPTFVAAPIFDDKAHADAGNPEAIWAWAVTHGRHTDANYREDGKLCGYLAGKTDLDFYLGDYRLAIDRVIEKYHLRLGKLVQTGQEATSLVPLQARPLIMTADPAEVSYKEQGWLLIAFIILCCCPCVGPIPLGVLFLFLCYARNDQYSGRHPVHVHDYGHELGAFS